MLVALLIACSHDWTTDWSGDWSGEIAFDTGYYSGQTLPLALFGMKYDSDVPNWSQQEGTWRQWIGDYYVQTDPGEDLRYPVRVWQCEDEDVCTTPGTTVQTGQYIATCYAGTVPYVVFVGTFGDSNALGALGDGVSQSTGAVTLHPD